MVSISRPNHAESMANAASFAECSAILKNVPQHNLGLWLARTSGKIQLGRFGVVGEGMGLVMLEASSLGR